MFVITHIIDDDEVYTYEYDHFREFRIKLQEIRRRFPKSRVRRYYTNQGLLDEVVVSSYSRYI